MKTSLMIGVAATGIVASGPAYAEEADKSGLGIIIVTAQKREQSVQNVPIAVTAVTQETLEANRITTVNDLGSIAPGLTVQPSAGGIQTPSFTIRGQNSFGVVAGSDKQVSIYLDGVYISSPRGSIFDLPDIARLEVLRGPQGTLFGRNATAGAVSVVTRDPTGEARVKAQASFGNYNSQRFRVSVDLPQFGPFSAYFSFMRNKKDGDILNAGAGTVWDRTSSPDPLVAKIVRSPRTLGAIDANSYFAALKFDPGGDFNMVYKFDRNEDNGTPEGTSLISFSRAYPQLGPSAPLLAPILNAIYDNNNIFLNPTNRRPKTVANSWVIPRRQRVYGHSLTANWQATDSISVKNIAAHRVASVFAPSAIDGSSSLPFPQQAIVPFATLSAISTLGAGFFALPPAQQGAIIGQFAAGLQPFVGGRYLGLVSQANSISKQWSNELQVNYSSDKLQVTVGALWFRSKDQAGGAEGQGNTYAFTLPPLPANGVIPLGNEGRYFNQATSIAAYAQIEYRINDQLELVLGGRITNDKKTSSFRWDINNVPQATIVPAPYKDTRFNYLIGLNWKPNDDILVYGKYSTSFVSGGSVAGITFVPETAKSFELGLKADLLDRRLRANLALYYVDYANFQQPSSINTSPAALAFVLAAFPGVNPALPGRLSTFVSQSHDVRAKGLELELTALPTDGLTLGGSIAYTDSEFRNIDPVFLAAQGGEHLPFTRPKWTGSAYASYETQPLFDEATIVLRVDGLYRSRRSLSSRPNVLMGFGVPANALSTPGHWKINARAALTKINVGGAQAELAVWGRNLTDADYSNSILHLPNGNAANYDPARTYGVDVTIEF
ncbi:MAG: TonB-dependent receptor [Novosphingobium sp.]|nr:TonB-dependent receptor [Novosphingobium sp.]